MKRILPVCQHSIMLLLFLTCLLSACKKMDTTDTPVPPRPQVTGFFDLPEDAPSAIRKTVAEFERQDKITGFVKGMVATEGMPLWEKSVIEVRKKSIIPTAGFNGDGGFEIEDTLVFTPILEEDSLSVNGFFMSKITGDSVELHLFRGNDYDNYSHGNVRSNSLTAERVSLELMKMNYQVFGYTEFIVTDSLLFADDTGVDSNLVYRRVKLKIDQQNGFAGNTPSTNNFLVSTIELCNWGSCPQIERTTPGGGGTPHCRTCWTVTILHDDFPDGSPNPTAGGEGGGMGTPPANGNCTGTTNCRQSSIILEGRLPCGNCGPGPIIYIPYVCTYQMTPQEIAIFAAIDAEDDLADYNYENLDCEGTNRTGNILFQGTKEHLLIQAIFASSNPTYGRVEFAIPGSSASGNRGYADMVNVYNGNIFEIKPNNLNGIENGTIEVNRYVTKANQHCTSVLPFGTAFNTTGTFPEINLPTNMPNKYLNAKLVSPGVVGYSYITTTTPPIPAPIVAPSSIFDKFKELFRRLKDNVGAYDAIISEYLHQHPELTVYIKTLAWGAAIAVVVGTIAEDFFTVGGGISDDLACFYLAKRIVQFARALP